MVVSKCLIQIQNLKFKVKMPQPTEIMPLFRNRIEFITENFEYGVKKCTQTGVDRIRIRQEIYLVTSALSDLGQRPFLSRGEILYNCIKFLFDKCYELINCTVCQSF